MNTPEEVMLWHALYQLETRYWHEVDANGGRNAHEFYLPDGLMVVGHNRFQGRDKIKEFYTWRERQAVTAISSVKTTRHLINNLFVESSGDSAARPHTNFTRETSTRATKNFDPACTYGRRYGSTPAGTL